MNLLHFSFYQGPRFKADLLKLLKSLKIFQTWSFIRLTGQKNMAFNEYILKANRQNCMRKMDATQSFTAHSKFSILHELFHYESNHDLNAGEKNTELYNVMPNLKKMLQKNKMLLLEK